MVLLWETRPKSPPLPAGAHLCSSRFLIHLVLKNHAMDPPERIDRGVGNSSSNLIGQRGMEGINPAAVPGREHFFQGGRWLLFQGQDLEIN